MELILVILIIIWFLISLLTVGKIAVNVDNEGCAPIIGIKDYICNLFINRNLFGIILSIINLIISIPALIMVIVLQLMDWLLKFLDWVWKLGNKS